MRFHSAGGAESCFRWQVFVVGRLVPKMLGGRHDCLGLFCSFGLPLDHDGQVEMGLARGGFDDGRLLGGCGFGVRLVACRSVFYNICLYFIIFVVCQSGLLCSTMGLQPSIRNFNYNQASATMGLQPKHNMP